ncbi:MAG: hypothetical protein MZV64_20135 [Ignavibacteriales bacterium]|nr:hypothetical protein [Ignavibacteriales bacterium]
MMTFNKYIDGELDHSSLQHVNEVLSGSIEDKKRMNALLTVHNALKKVKEEEVDPSFTELLMKKLQYRKKAFKEQRNFVLMISSIFVTAIFVVVGLVVYSAFTHKGFPSFHKLFELCNFIFQISDICNYTNIYFKRNINFWLYIISRYFDIGIFLLRESKSLEAKTFLASKAKAQIFISKYNRLSFFKHSCIFTIETNYL